MLSSKKYEFYSIIFYLSKFNHAYMYFKKKETGKKYKETSILIKIVKI